MPALITIAQFGNEFGVSRSPIYRLKERNELPFVYIGRAVRIRRADAEKWYANLTGNANDG
jgi:excisionase family DNA binding protein